MINKKRKGRGKKQFEERVEEGRGREGRVFDPQAEVGLMIEHIQQHEEDGPVLFILHQRFLLVYLTLFLYIYPFVILLYIHRNK